MQSLLSKARLRLKMTAATVVDVIARLLDCHGQSSWRRVSTHSWKGGGCSQIAQSSQVRMSRRMDTPSTTQVTQIMGKHWRTCGASWTKLVWSPISLILVVEEVPGSSVGAWMGKKNRFGKGYLFIENKGYFCQYVWTTFKNGWERSRMWLPCGRDWWKTLVLENLHNFLTMYIWDVLNVNANRMKQLLNNIRKYMNHVFLLKRQKNLPGWENLKQKTWNGMLKNALSDTVNWQTRKRSNFKKSQTLVWMVINSSTNWTTWRSVVRQQVCEISRKMDSSIWQTLGKADFFYIHHTTDHRQSCHVGNTALHCSTSGGVLCIFGSRTSVPVSWMCFLQQTAVSHSCTESQIISLDAGLRMDGLLAIDLRDVVIEVPRLSNSTEAATDLAAGNCSRNLISNPTEKGNRDVDRLSDVDHVTTNAHSSHSESQLYIFEDNEAVIKMIVEGRSPTMRYVSRTHRGSLVNPENDDERKEFERASRQLVLPNSNSKIGYSQASRQENVPQATRKLVLED